jgi:hypothetical protein
MGECSLSLFVTFCHRSFREVEKCEGAMSYRRGVMYNRNQLPVLNIH